MCVNHVFKHRVDINADGMLDCGKNFKTGYRGENCPSCNVLDDENHRINYCKKYKDTNLFDSALKIDFNSLYSGNEETTKMVVEVVCEIWNLHNGKNKMYPPLSNSVRHAYQICSNSHRSDIVRLS